MDKSYHAQVFGGLGRSPYSPRTRESSASSVVSGRKSVHAIGGLRKGPLSGRHSLSGRSNQSLQIVAKSEYHIVESYGLPMPVLVSEALTFSERNSVVSLSCSENGWAWAVYGRRLFVWQYKEIKFGSPKSTDFSRTPQRRVTTAQCRELTLPHCDIGHKASLITVFIPEGQQMASCLAVSPTGDVRYWPSIAHDGSSIDSAGILEGQEFDHILSISPIGYILVTTTCNLVLLQIQLQSGRHIIQHRVIKPPSGFFGGIGKKFASIIIGMNSGQEKENKFVKVVAEFRDQSEWIVTVLSDRWIQRWAFKINGNEQFLVEDHELIRKFREIFQQKFWSGRENNEIEVILLDMQLSDSKMILLCGAVNNAHTPQMHYALVTLQEENDAIKILNFYPLKLSLFCSPSTEFECTKIKFILNRNMAYVYGERIIYPINIQITSTNDGDLEKIEFQSQGDKILNAIVCSHIPLFFSRSHGLVSVSPSDFDPSDFVNSSFSPDVITSPALSESLNQTVLSTNLTTIGNNLTMYDLDPNEIYNDTRDLNSHLKAAFIFHLKRNFNACNNILKDLFSNENLIEEIDSPLDKMVISIAQDLAEDIPATDPRWKQETFYNKHGIGSSNSLQILTQLREKNLAMNHFIEFLHTTGLWEKLNAITYRGTIKSTAHLLSDIDEKIVAAIALKCAQNSYPRIIEESIEQVLIEWNVKPTGNLIHQDLFYVKPTQIEDIFRIMIERFTEGNNDISHISPLICDVNLIILAILNEIIQYRDSKSEFYALPTNKKNSFEYLPWTAMSGKNGLRDSLLNLINITLKHGARSTGEPEIKQKLYQQLMDLIDFVLDGRKNFLESVKDNEKYGVLLQQYECQRRDLIYPLVEDEQYELAAKLAEKYLDFQILVIICDRTENQERLNNYIEKYKEYDFSQFAINWHLRQNKQGELFERFKGNQAALTKFLGDHPSLAWIQLIFNGEMFKASTILIKLAQNEVEFVTRKKTMLSLAKLAALAIEFDSTISEINSELLLIEYQEQLPENLLAAFGYDAINQKVLKPEEIINLLISDENEYANEFDFRKALELLNFVEDPFEVKHKIWCAAILKDSWTECNTNTPLDKMQNTIFFKLIDLCYLMDGELEEFLPPMEDFLNSPELDELTNDKTFQYLFKLGYEHIIESYHKKDIEQE